MRWLALTLSVLVSATLPLPGQESCLQQLKFPQVGRWAEYKASYNEKEPHTIRYSVIGTEQRGDKALKWLEMRMAGTAKDRDLIYQMLVPGSPAEMGEVQEIVFKAGDKPAMKMGGMMIKMIRDQIEKQAFFDKVCQEVTMVGKERVTVPAGQFQAQHSRSAKYGIDTWITPGVSFSLVKSVGENHQMELVGQGHGAKSSITEKPQEMRGLETPPPQ